MYRILNKYGYAMTVTEMRLVHKTFQMDLWQSQWKLMKDLTG